MKNKTVNSPESPDVLLDAVYEKLEYLDGALLNALSYPEPNTDEAQQWVEKGEWLSLAARIGASKVFFVKNDPVLVFSKFPHQPSETDLLRSLRLAWSMARPQRIFIAFPGELRVYPLNQSPAQNLDDWQVLASINSASEVLTELKQFHRAQIESYRFLETEQRFGSIEQRADRQLIHDLKQVRKELVATGLKPEVTHALIGRSIFVRYLEDRGVLVEEDFAEVAAGNPRWEQILRTAPEKPIFASTAKQSLYERVLRDKEFAGAFFDRLRRSFNGNLFPVDDEEWKLVGTEHLQLIRQFLFSDTDPNQPKLFFWAYAFDVIPIELISNIYEEFYHQDTANDDKGTHYTPGTLVEYVLSNLLTEDLLQTNPRVIDPACGSGIFLVESYRRMIRYWIQANEGKNPPPKVLRQILQEQICGIEINRDAIHVTAFSLYLALLHYQDPPAIRKHRLPNLIYQEDMSVDGDNDYQILHHANAFNLTEQERKDLQLKLSNRESFSGRVDVERILQANQHLALSLQSFDVVVGNPPWEELGEKIVPITCGSLPRVKLAEGLPRSIKYDAETQEISFTDLITDAHLKKAKAFFPPTYYTLLEELKSESERYFQPRQWAKVFDRKVGDNSYSQLFIHRALSLVRYDGVVGLLVHSSTLFNQRSTSQEFREQWLKAAQIEKIVNFSDARKLYFERGIAPFIFSQFTPRSSQNTASSFTYISAKETKAAELSKAVILTNYDIKIVDQEEVIERDYLWKTYWWGNHRDAQLIAKLNLYPSLETILDKRATSPGFGFQKGSKPLTGMIGNVKALSSKKMVWYGPLKEDWFELPPAGIKTNPDQGLYTGQRLLVGEGIKKDGVCVRLEYEDFPYRHTIFGVPLTYLPEWQAKLIVGTFWSSLGKYRMFLTSAHWGTWYDKINKTDILSMPIHLPQQRNEIVDQIVEAVDRIREWQPSEKDLTGEQIGRGPSQHILDSLDEAVFRLFNLPEFQEDLVRDFVEYKFDLFKQGAESIVLNLVNTRLAVNQGTVADLPRQVKRERQTELEAYLLTFLQIWNAQLADINGELHWLVLRSRDLRWQSVSPPLMAVVFSSQEIGSQIQNSLVYQQKWQDVLSQLGESFRQPISRRIYIDGIIRAVNETSLAVIKRDESHLWTRSLAREDAEATMLQVMNLQQIEHP